MMIVQYKIARPLCASEAIQYSKYVCNQPVTICLKHSDYSVNLECFRSLRKNGNCKLRSIHDAQSKLSPRTFHVWKRCRPELSAMLFGAEALRKRKATEMASIVPVKLYSKQPVIPNFNFQIRYHSFVPCDVQHIMFEIFLFELTSIFLGNKL